MDLASDSFRRSRMAQTAAAVGRACYGGVSTRKGMVEGTAVRSSSRCQKQSGVAPSRVFWQIEDEKCSHDKPWSKSMGLVCWRLERYIQHGRSALIVADHKGWKGYPNANCGY